MSPTILLTGVSETIGSFLLEELMAQDMPVRVLMHPSEDVPDRCRTEITDLVVDALDDPASIQPALDGIHRLFLFSPPSLDQVARQGSVVEAVERAGRPIHLVTVSVVGAVPSDISLQLAQWQTVTEAQIRSTGLPATILQSQFLMQHLFCVAPSIRDDNLICGAFGTARLPLVDARDVAAVAATVLTTSGHENESYLLTGPQALSGQEIAAIFSAELARTIHYVDLPTEAYHEYLVGEGLPYWIAEDVTTFARAIRAGHVGQISPDTAALLGKPGRTLQQFVKKHAGVFRSSSRAVSVTPLFGSELPNVRDTRG